MQELKKSIIEDGKVDADEVSKLKEVMLKDGVIDRYEANLLFEINDACSGADNDPSWDEFFVDAICDHLLSDVQSPGYIDEDEAKYIFEKVIGDGKVDELEKKLLAAISQKATTIPVNLADKINFLGIK